MHVIQDRRQWDGGRQSRQSGHPSGFPQFRQEVRPEPSLETNNTPQSQAYGELDLDEGLQGSSDLLAALGGGIRRQAGDQGHENDSCIGRQHVRRQLGGQHSQQVQSRQAAALVLECQVGHQEVQVLLETLGAQRVVQQELEECGGAQLADWSCLQSKIKLSCTS